MPTRARTLNDSPHTPLGREAAGNKAAARASRSEMLLGMLNGSDPPRHDALKRLFPPAFQRHNGKEGWRDLKLGGVESSFASVLPLSSSRRRPR